MLGSFETNTGMSSRCTWGQGLWSCYVGQKPSERPWWAKLRPFLAGAKLLLLIKSFKDMVRAWKVAARDGGWGGEGDSGKGK